ncbi:MAG: NADH-quinone oxidoreductase subunit H [Desulfurococcaceae archaeon]
MEFAVVATVLALVSGLLIPVLLDGVERKLKATLQSRIGPPIVQTFYDILKLLDKEYKPLHTESYIIYILLSFLLVSITSLALSLLYSLTGYTLYIIYASTLFALSTALFVSIPLLVPNPFSQIGAWREIMIALLNEVAFLLSIALSIVTLETRLHWPPDLSVLGAILVLLMLFISGYIATGRPPFDIAEAEPELASGVFVEFSGPMLALNAYSLLLKRLVVKVIIASLLVNLLKTSNPLISLALVYLLVLVTWIVFTVVSVLLGRTRVDVGFSTLAKIYIPLIASIITVLLVDAYV